MKQGTPFTRGDANDDGGMDIADAVSVLSYLFANGKEPACLDSADTNDSGEIDIADVVALLGNLFASGDPLPAPFYACDADPTPEAPRDLPCEQFDHCPW
jgi:hypothetical protein